MENRFKKIDRRTFVSAAAAGAAAQFALLGERAHAGGGRVVKSAVGMSLPVIGMGSWLTFDVGQNRKLRQDRIKVLEAFFGAGGGMIDSSPMYGTSEEVIGFALKNLPPQPNLISATKVWTISKWLGIRQMETSKSLWGIERFDLMQIHNMLDWEAHLETLTDWKASGRVRHIGITTSHGRRHEALASVMETQPFDFVQFTYNIKDREAEKRLLPLAQERGLGVIINRPFQRGGLFDHVKGRPLPDWSNEIGCATWGQFFLKFVVSHPAVTCAIPATRRVDHMRENMAAGITPMPDAAMRRKMAAYFDNL